MLNEQQDTAEGLDTNDQKQQNQDENYNTDQDFEQSSKLINKNALNQETKKPDNIDLVINLTSKKLTNQKNFAECLPYEHYYFKSQFKNEQKQIKLNLNKTYQQKIIPLNRISSPHNFRHTQFKNQKILNEVKVQQVNVEHNFVSDLRNYSNKNKSLNDIQLRKIILSDKIANNNNSSYILKNLDKTINQMNERNFETKKHVQDLLNEIAYLRKQIDIHQNMKERYDDKEYRNYQNIQKTKGDISKKSRDLFHQRINAARIKQENKITAESYLKAFNENKIIEEQILKEEKQIAEIKQMILDRKHYYKHIYALNKTEEQKLMARSKYLNSKKDLTFSTLVNYVGSLDKVHRLTNCETDIP